MYSSVHTNIGKAQTSFCPFLLEIFSLNSENMNIKMLLS